MGRTSKPVRILVLDADLFQSAEVQDLIAKGHPIELLPAPLSGHERTGSGVQLHEFDLILGRSAWYCDTKHLKYLEKVTIPAVRKRIDYHHEKETTQHAA